MICCLSWPQLVSNDPKESLGRLLSSLGTECVFRFDSTVGRILGLYWQVVRVCHSAANSANVDIRFGR